MSEQLIRWSVAPLSVWGRVTSFLDKLAGFAQKHIDRSLYPIIAERRREHRNPFVRFGAKCFSQTDEDGITLEITKRLGLSEGVFAEFGVGDGRENNTLLLLALGWKGIWVGGEDLAFDPKSSKRLMFKKSWITRDNIRESLAAGLLHFGLADVDLISMDLDGNDYHCCEELLKSGVRPKIFIVEYNAKFPPPIAFVMAYDANHVWRNNDYFGASLQSYSDLFKRFGYSLVCCNAATGANAFFVQDACRDRFPEVPSDLEGIYTPPFYDLFLRYGHKSSIETVKAIVNR